LINTGGSITLASSDPFAHPIIDVNMLSEPVDLAIMREAFRSARKLLSAPVFKGSVFESLYPPGNLTTDDELDSFIHSTVGPYFHSVGSAGMSPRGANWGVVDPDHRVKGTNGLRVIDVSVLVKYICLWLLDWFYLCCLSQLPQAGILKHLVMPLRSGRVQ